MSAGKRLAMACGLLLMVAPGAPARAFPAARAAAQAASPQQSSSEDEILFAPVELDGRVLFNVRGANLLPAPQRAAAIAERITSLAEDPAFDPATLRAETIPGGARIAAADGRLVMNVYDADSVLQGFSHEGVSATILPRVRDAIVAYRADRTPEALLSSALHALGALLILAGAIWLVLRISRSLDALLERKYRARLTGVGIGSFTFLRPEHLWSALRAVTAFARWAACLALIFVGMRYELGAFPHSRGMAARLDELVMGPLARLGSGALDFVPSLFFLAILFVVARWVMRLTRVFFEAVQHGTVTLESFEPEWAMPTYRLIRIGIIALAVVVAYPYIPGSESAAFKGVTLFLGVLISLGSSSSISNIVAGYMLTYRRAFRVGDRVRIGDVVGDVTEVRLQVTHVRTPKHEAVTIPNSVIIGSQVVNYSTLARSQGLAISVTVGIGYETPWRQVEAMLLLAAERTPGLLAEPKPFVQHVGLGDFAVSYELYAFCDAPQQMIFLRTALQRSVLDAFNEYGVQIMTPAYEGDPTEPKLVPPDRWHAAPAPREEPRGAHGVS